MKVVGTSYSGPLIDMAGRYATTNAPLLQLTYVSRRSPNASEDVLINMLIGAAVRNFLAGLSGQLWVSPQFFVQTIEGSAGPVDFTFDRIALDGRHTQVTCLERKRVSARHYSRPMCWERIVSEQQRATGVPALDPVLRFDEACESLIRRGPITGSQ